jgi:hypothetical protein
MNYTQGVVKGLADMNAGTTLPAVRVPARAAALAVLGATAAAAAIWTAVTAAGVRLTAGFGGGQPIHVTLVSVVATALLAGLAGWGLLGLLGRFTTEARRAWSVTALVAALLSLAGPLIATASAGTKVSLITMHLAVATVLILVLRRTTR